MTATLSWSSQLGSRLSAPLRTRASRPAVVLVALSVLGTVWLAAVVIGALPARAAFAPEMGWWRLLQGVHSPTATRAAVALNILGGGWTSARLTALIVGVLVLLRGWRSGLFIAACCSVSAIDVMALKSVAGRLRPPDELVAAAGASFPSGHTANAAVLAVACALVLRRRWVWFPAVGWIVLMASSRTYLNVHRASDALAGALVGAAVAIVVWFAVPAGSRRAHSRTILRTGPAPCCP